MSSDARWVAALVVAALARSLLFGVLTPPYQAGDEPWHLDYARAVSEWQWPVLGKTLLDQAIVDHDRGVAASEALPLYGIDDPPMSREAYQPPLGYLLPAAGYAVAGGPAGALIWFRTVSALLGAVVAAAAFLLGRRAFPASAWAAPFAGIVAVCLPSMAAVTSKANNDPLALVLALVVLMGAVHVVRHGGGFPRFALLGALVGLAGWAKASSLLLLGPVVVAAFVAPRSSPRWSRAAVAALAATAVISPWLLRNVLVYGDVAGTAGFETAFVAHPGRHLGGWALLSWSRPRHPDAEYFWPELGRSSIGLFGWSDVPLPAWSYLLGGLASVVLVACAVSWLRRAPSLERRVTIVLLSVIPPYLVGVAWFSMTVDYQPQGRYVMPGLLAAAVVGGAGLGRLSFVAATVVMIVLLAAGVAATVDAYGWP